MKERPILFSGPMVRAILDGRKTQTRRVNRFGVPGDRLWVRETWADVEPLPSRTPAYDGARFAVRPDGSSSELWYRADGEMGVTSLLFDDGPRWRPSIHMPRWASRITLEIVDVRVERLHDITEEDARAEGVDWASPQPFGEKWDDDDREDPREVGYGSGSFALDNFRRLWSSINGSESWAANPWVWRVEFRRVDQ